MEEVFSSYEDVDGNFLEQFQTTGFDARSFELYVYAFLSREGYTLDRTKPNPDFLIQRNGIAAGIEVTTVNPATSGPLSDAHRKKIEDMSHAELLEYQQNELAIRFGSPLFSKLQKKYWELPHCKNTPLVVFIQAFFDQDALVFSDSALSSYLYGINQTGQWSKDGELSISTEAVTAHAANGKTIPSNFFNLPGAEHISAVVFSNSGSLAKFDRMGFHHGYGNANYNLTRFGTSFNPDPDAMDPTVFIYDVGQPPFVEHWGQGLVVNHNPSALLPLPDDYFGPVVNTRIKKGRMVTDLRGWHPISTKTLGLHLHDAKEKLEHLLVRPGVAVGAINKREFQAIVGINHDENPLIEEQGWFADATNSFLGVTLFDKQDKDWGWVILARDPFFRFRAIEADSGLPSRREACQAMQQKICNLVVKPQRIFVQD